MAHRTGADAAAACFAAVRTLAGALQQLQASPGHLGKLPGALKRLNGSSSQICTVDIPFVRAIASITPFAGGLLNSSKPSLNVATYRYYSIGRLGLLPGVSKALSAAIPTGAVDGQHGPPLAYPSQESWQTLMQHTQPPSQQQRRCKHSWPQHKDSSKGGGKRGGKGADPNEDPLSKKRRRYPRFGPSPRIMDTASLQELGTLAAAEAAGWNAKELAAASRRVVTLWRREYPSAARRLRAMVRLAPPPPPPLAAATMDATVAEVEELAGGGGGGGGGTGGSVERGVAEAAAMSRRAAAVVCRTSLVHTPLRPHERWLAELLERLVRGATARLSQGFGTRELSTVLWSLTGLGYWQPPLLPLAAAFLDYGAERLRGADAIAMASVLQVMARAQAAAAVGQPTAGRVLELAPPAVAVVAAALPPRLPSCDPKTLTGLLHSCAALLAAPPQQHARTPLTPQLSAAPGSSTAQHSSSTSSSNARENANRVAGGSGGGAAGGQATPESLAALAKEVARECVRRRFVGFGPKGLITVASALTSLRRSPTGALPSSSPAASPSLDSSSSPAGGAALTAPAGTSFASDVGSSAAAAAAAAGAAPEDDAEVWQVLVAAAVSPLAPEMASASGQQWSMLLELAESRGAPNAHLLHSAAAAAAGVAEGRSVAAISAPTHTV